MKKKDGGAALRVAERLHPAIKIGSALWRAAQPWKRLKRVRNRRRKRLGLPLLPITQEDDKMFPKGTMTKSGAVIAMLGPVIGLVLGMLGVGSSCPADLPDCQTSGELANTLATSIGGLITFAGGVIAWKGRNRVGK